MSKWAGITAAWLISLCLAFIAITPPRSQGPDMAADKFSSARAMVDIRKIAVEPHPTGSAENAKVRAYLQSRLTELGFETSQQIGALGTASLQRLERWSGTAKAQQKFYNIIGIKRGNDSSLPALLLMAHHDTVWGSPGAADDSLGIAAILETLRALNHDTPDTDQAVLRDIIVLFTDAEELGLVGARHFFASHPLKDQIGAVINLEARGGGGTANLFQTSKNNGDLARGYSAAVSVPSASSLSTFVYDILPNDTDLTPALERDYAAYNIANIGRAQYYHSPKITPDALDEATLQHMGQQILELTRALLLKDGFPGRSNDTVFFDVFGVFMLIYAPYWGWVFLGLSALFYIISIGGRWRAREIALGSAKMSGFLIGGAALLYGLNLLSGHGAGGRSGSNYYDRLAAIPRLEILALIFTLGFGAYIFGRVNNRVNNLDNNRANMCFGAALPLLVIGIAGQALAPTATYFISLPLMLCAIGSWAGGSPALVGLSRRKAHSPIKRSLIVMTAALTCGYMLSLGHLLMLGIGADLLSVSIMPASLGILALLPLWPQLRRNWIVYVFAAAAILAASALALWVRYDPLAATVPLY